MECLREALKNKGYSDIEVHETPQNLYGYHNDKRVDTAEVIIRRKFVGSASNDIGFKRNANGNFEAIISQFDGGKHNKKWLDDLKMDYSQMKVKKIAKAAGGQLLSQKNVNGKIRLQFTVKA